MIHGGRLEDARRRFGGRREDWLDLSTGINPVAWVAPDFTEVDWSRLPDPRALYHLERTAAAFFGTDPAFCMAVPGSEAGLRGVVRMLGLPGRNRALTYSTHVDAFADLAPDAGAKGSVMVIANPNNPDGLLLAPESLLALLEQQEREGGWLLVDEAFVECHHGFSVAGLVQPGRKLIVSRSFGKFFGLAGLRLGFVIAPPEVIAPLRRLFGDWPVGAAAVAWGTLAYTDRHWIAKTREALATRARDLDALLMRHGLTPLGECPLFRLVESDDAHRLFDALAERSILTRPFADHPRLLRFGVPATEAERVRLGGALAEIAAGA